MTINILVTGASRGIGAAILDALKLPNAKAVGQGTSSGIPADFTDPAAPRALWEAALEQLDGRIDVLINNAGYGQYGPLEEISLDALRLQFETNVFGGLRLSQLVLPAMRRAGHGRIVNVSSVAGRVSSIGGGAYHASKFAIEALTDALRPEVEPFGIDVVNVLPGPIATHFEATLLKTIPDTGPQSPYAYFKQRLAQRMHSFLDPDGFGVMSAETVARIVFKAATANRPRTRYSVGFIAHLGPIGRALTPDRVVDFMTRRKVPVGKP